VVVLHGLFATYIARAGEASRYEDSHDQEEGDNNGGVLHLDKRRSLQIK
jgi:hypothetical protein